MTVLNFPASPSNGDTYEENGVVYTWNGSYWSANNASDLGNIYVAIAGDRMTGNLELPGGGGDTAALQKQEIQLMVDAGGGGGTGPTDLYWERDAGALSPKVSTDNVDIGDGKILLNAADGSITAENFIDSGYTSGTGLIRIRKDNGNQNAFSIYQGSSYDYKFAIDGDGNVGVGGVLNAGVAYAPNITLNADGSATFAGNIQSNWKDGTTFGCELASQGLISVRNDSANDFVFRAYKNTFAEDVAHITNDGSAEFVGGWGNDNGVLIDTNGFNVRADSGRGLGIYSGGNADSNRTISLNGDGSATFDSQVQTSDLRINYAGGGISGYRSIDVRGDNNSQVAAVFADGSANFEGTVTAPKFLALTSNGLNCFYDSGKIAHDHVNFFVVQGSDIGVYLPSGQTVWQPTTSERRLKENIEEIDSNTAWETIKSTPYYSYNFIGTEATNYGPMADEVPAEMVVQPMVEDEDGNQVARADAEGPVRTYDNGMLQARLYTALQTALTRIEALEARLDEVGA